MAKKKPSGKKPAKKKARKPARKAAKPARKARPAPKAKRPAAASKPAARARRKKEAREPAEPILPWRQALPGESLVGVVDDFFSHVDVIALSLRAQLAVGDRIHVRGHTTDLLQTVESLQIDHRGVESAGAGDAVGIRVHAKCRAGDYVYRCAG